LGYLGESRKGQGCRNLLPTRAFGFRGGFFLASPAFPLKSWQFRYLLIW
jgi:hypothetical protein